MSSRYVVLVDESGQAYLAHHGIKGQKWGIRRFQNSDGTLTGAGKNRYGDLSKYKNKRAGKVYERIHGISNDSKRKSYMTMSQKQSLKKAEKYWKEKAEGKTPTEKRGLIKRQADKYRSRSLATRAGATAVSQILSSAPAMVITHKMGANIATGKIAANAVTNTAGSLLADELTNKIFGHF